MNDRIIVLNLERPGLILGGGGGGCSGLYNNAQNITKLDITDKTRNEVASPVFATNFSSKIGMIAVKTLDPAVTTPLTSPKYFLK